MRTYHHTMCNLISRFTIAEQNILASLIVILEDIIGDRKPIIFISNPGKHIFTRLALMIMGKNFVVVPTQMEMDDANCCFADNVEHSIILTDCKDKIKSPKLFKIKELSKSDFEVTNFDGAEFFKEFLYPHWSMVIYDFDRRINFITSNVFNLLFLNLVENLRKNSINNNNILLSSSEDFFIYYLWRPLSPNSITFDTLMNNNLKISITPTTKPYHLSDLFIEYEMFKNIWHYEFSTKLQNKLLFKWFFKSLPRKIILTILVRKFEKTFKAFKNIVVLGLINDSLLSEISSRLKGIKVYNTYGEVNNLMAMGISQKLGYIDIVPGLSNASISLKENRKKYTDLSDRVKGPSSDISNLVLSFRTKAALMHLTSEELFTFKDNHAKFLGYAFKNGICPTCVESIFNSTPFIKDSVLVWYNFKYILLLNIDEHIFDANHINYSTFEKIMNSYIKKINSELLPHTVQIEKFSIVPDFHKRYNRLGQLDKKFLYNLEYFA